MVAAMFEYVHHQACGDDAPVTTPQFTAHDSPAATTLRAHLALGNFPTLQSPPTGCPNSDIQADAPTQSSLVLGPVADSGDTDKRPLSALSTTVMVPANQGGFSPGFTPDLDFERNMEAAAALLQLPKYREMCSNKILKYQRPVKALSMKQEVSARDCRAQTSCTTSRPTYKRKFDSHDGVDTNKEHIKTSQDHTRTIKRICREKSGTDWQSVFDVIEYGKEQQRRRTVIPVTEKKSW
ncbi:hypothetical protein P692DRAFT_20823022 [Suillus brevipes Sb2]|nr:hypothetical protein P692DRAFT_20823022 [Suillus brevipes Sb2]